MIFKEGDKFAYVNLPNTRETLAISTYNLQKKDGKPLTREDFYLKAPKSKNKEQGDKQDAKIRDTEES